VSCPQEKIGIGPFEKNCKGKEYLNHVHWLVAGFHLRENIKEEIISTFDLIMTKELLCSLFIDIWIS
jgi:hypothetical protein